MDCSVKSTQPYGSGCLLSLLILSKERNRADRGRGSAPLKRSASMNGELRLRERSR
jgi:hypothetical protein